MIGKLFKNNSRNGCLAEKSKQIMCDAFFMITMTYALNDCLI